MTALEIIGALAVMLGIITIPLVALFGIYIHQKWKDGAL